MNLLFKEVDVVNNEFYINPVFLVVDEIAYDPEDNAIFVIGRNKSMYVSPILDTKHIDQFFDNLKYADKTTVDARNLAPFVDNDSDDFDKLIEYSRQV